MSDTEKIDEKNEQIEDVEAKVEEDVCEESEVEKTSDNESSEKPKKKSHLSQKRQLEYFKKRRKVHYIKILVARSRIFARLIAILLLVLLTVGLVKSSGWYLPKNIFNSYPSSHLKFEGNVITPNIKILNAVRKIKLPDKPVYLIDTHVFEKELLKLSPVKRVYVKRFGFPASLKIVIEERTPIISVAPQDNVPVAAAFTEDGTIIGRDFLPLSNKIQTYKVLTYEDYFGWTKKQVAYLAYMAKIAELYSKEEVRYIDLRNPDDVRIKIKSVVIRLGQLNKTVFKRLKKISAILPQTMNLDAEIEYIDLRWKDSAYIKLKKNK